MKKVLIIIFILAITLGVAFLYKTLLEGKRYKRSLGMSKRQFQKKYGCDFYNIYTEAMKNWLGYYGIAAAPVKMLNTWGSFVVKNSDGEENALYSPQGLDWINKIAIQAGYNGVMEILSSGDARTPPTRYKQAVLDNLKYVAQNEPNHIENMWKKDNLKPVFKTKMDSIGLDATNEEIKRIIKRSMEICVKNK